VVPRLTAIAARPAPSALRTTAIAALRRLNVPDSLIPNAPPRPARTGGAPAGQVGAQRSEADYLALVERWVVPAYNYEPRPRAVWETERGSIELELFAGDAPVAMEEFVRLVESGAIVGTEFGRVVPDFVAQMRTITGAALLRDEVNRHGLTRANLSWASGGLDTGRAGYTLGSTPQPHNEGDFTALGRVVRGMDVVDQLRLGDHVTGARMIR
jgi:cyclophilin family peptidyl-prolyl cis-trans isomerase